MTGGGTPLHPEPPWLCPVYPLVPSTFLLWDASGTSPHPRVLKEKLGLPLSVLRLSRAAACQSTPGAPAPAAQQENKAVQKEKGKRRILLHSCDPAQEASGPEWSFRESLPFL